MNKKIIVVGAGGWGTALAILLSQKVNVKLWCHEKETADEIAMNRTNSDFLPNVEIPENITPVADFSHIEAAEIIVNTVPTQFIRSVYSQMDFSFENKIIVNGSKGIERNTFKRISEIFSEVVNIPAEKYVSLSGPSHAEEVAIGGITAVLAASENIELAKEVRDLFSNNLFRAYSSNDVIGCELGGALKNIISIACGIIDGLELGDNAKAALMTRGLAEIARLGIAMGANSLTFSGLSGLGDLYVTCASKHSRNRKVGELIGKGNNLKEVLYGRKMVTEGVYTTESVYQLAKKMNIPMPITEQIYNILYNETSVQDVVKILMNRNNKDEIW